MFTIKKLYLKNFMIVDEAEFDFDDNQVTAIIGDNANGKSTIFYAIAYCLTGYRKGETLRDYIKVGCTSTNIILDAIYKDRPISYDVSITKTGATSQATKKTVTYNGTTYINSEYNTFIKEENLEELETLMFMFQGNSTLINYRPAERANLLKKIFNSEFPVQVEQCKDNIEQTKINLTELNAVLDELKTRTFENVDILRELGESYIKDCKDRLQENTDKINQIGTVDDSELTKNETNLINCQKQINDTISKITSDEESLKTNRDRLGECDKEIKAYDSDKLNTTVSELEKKIAEHEKAYEIFKTRYDELNDRLNILTYKKKELDNQYKISKTGVCHACGQPIEESHVKKLEKEIEDNKFQISQTNDQIEELNFDPKDTEGKNLKKELEYNKNLIQKIEQQIKIKQSIEEKITDLEANLSDRKNYLTLLNTKKEELLKYKEEIEKIIPLINEKETLLKEKKDLEDKLEYANSIKVSNIERRATNAKIEKEKKECENRIEELSLNINNLSVENNKRKVVLDIFETQFPNYIVIKMCDRLNIFINSVIQKVFPYCKVKLMPSRSGVNFFYTTTESEDDYVPISMASGAQEKILNLAYFIALSKLSGMSCVFLDEIDASCSPNNAKEIYDFIASLDCFNQIFFISHREEAMEAVRSKNENLVTYVVTNGKYTKL